MTAPDFDSEAWASRMISRAIDAGALDIQPNPRCKVCRTDSVRAVANRLIALGDTLTDVVQALEPINATLPQADRVNYHDLWRHRHRDFDIQASAYAVHRQIAERKAREMGQDYELGVGNIVNYLSFLHSMMIKGYETLIDPETVISPDAGLKAARDLEDIRRESEGEVDKAQLVAEMGHIISVVRQFVPKDQWTALQAALSGEEEEAPRPISSRRTDEVEMIPIMNDHDDAVFEDN